VPGVASRLGVSTIVATAEMGPMDEVIGWVSSAILVVTITAQLHKQWKAGTSKGVSKWLFIGQFAASVGFVSYSWRIGNWVFVATNALLGVEALLGLGIVLMHRRQHRTGGRPHVAREPAGA
jgi:MtN3 and saliva related transmembrane protein